MEKYGNGLVMLSKQNKHYINIQISKLNSLIIAMVIIIIVNFTRNSTLYIILIIYIYINNEFNYITQWINQNNALPKVFKIKLN